LAQAQAAAALLRGHGIVSLVSSPVSRARHTAEIVAAAIGVTVGIEPDLRETSYGDRDGQPMGEWFQDWVAGRSTPVGGESFADLRLRAVAAANRALARPAPVLVVAHGGLFRALRAEMGLEPNIRTANGVPFHCLPPDSPSAPWHLTPVSAI